MLKNVPIISQVIVQQFLSHVFPQCGFFIFFYTTLQKEVSLNATLQIHDAS